MSAPGTPATIKEGQSRSALPGYSDVNLLNHGEGVVDVNAEIPDGALDLGVSQQSTVCRVCSVNSNLTGRPVFFCRTVA